MQENSKQENRDELTSINDFSERAQPTYRHLEDDGYISMLPSIPSTTAYVTGIGESGGENYQRNERDC